MASYGPFEDIEVTVDNFDTAVLKSEGLVMVYYYATCVQAPS